LSQNEWSFSFFSAILIMFSNLYPLMLLELLSTGYISLYIYGNCKYSTSVIIKKTLFVQLLVGWWSDFKQGLKMDVVCKHYYTLD
jgi:hypothetical protein